MAFQAALLSSVRIVPGVTIVESIYLSMVGNFKPYLGQFSASTHRTAVYFSAEGAGLRVRSDNLLNKARHVEAAASLG